MAARDDDRQSDLAVMDANEYKQKRRLERILDAHDQVEDRANDAWERYVAGDIGADAKNVVILRAVQQLIREVHNLLVEYSESLDDEDRNEYWEGFPPSEDKDPGLPLGRIQFQSRDDIVFYGLRDIQFADWFYSEEWTETVQTRHGPNRTETHRREYTVPEEVSWRAYLRVKEFLSKEHGLELSFETIEVDEEADPF